MKPEFFTDEELYDAEIETGLPLRLAYEGLWCCADREGRFEWRPRTLKTYVLPHDQVDFSRVLDALWTRGWLVKYASRDGREYGLLPNFPRHQVLNNREAASILPDPAECDLTPCPHEVLTRGARVDDACATRAARDVALAKGKGREGNGTEGNGTEGNGKGEGTRALSRLTEEGQRALNRLLQIAPLPDGVIGEVNMVLDGGRPGTPADPAAVSLALADMAANGAKWGAGSFRSYVQRAAGGIAHQRDPSAAAGGGNNWQAVEAKLAEEEARARQT